MKKIKFSIITTSYNRLDSGYLEQCIKSVQTQVGENFEYEHIIVNDGSTDGTEIYLEKAASKDKNIKVINQPNGGPAKATQSGIKKAKGDYVIILDDDDMLSPGSLKKRAGYILKNPNVDFFYGHAKWINEFGLEIEPLFKSMFFEDHLYERMLIENIIHGGTPTIRRAVVCSIVWPDWVSRSQDYFMWLEILRPEKKNQVGFLDEIVFCYRWHSAAYTNGIYGNSNSTKKKEDLNLKIKNLHPEPLVFLADQAKKRQTEINRINQAIKEEHAELTRELFLAREELNNLKASRLMRLALRLRVLLRRVKSLVARLPRKAYSLIAGVVPRKMRKIIKKLFTLVPSRRGLEVEKKIWNSADPLITVVTPFYNQGDTLISTVTSVLSQTFQDFEYIIINDGSTDEKSIGVVNSIKHPRVKIVNQENIGKGSPAPARNRGIELAKGKYIVCLDSDDCLEPTFFEKAVAVLEFDPMISIVGMDMKTVGAVSRDYLFGEYNPLDLLKNNSVAAPAMFRRIAWEAVGGFKKNIGYEDWEFWINLAEKGYWAKNLPEKLLIYNTVLDSRYTRDINRHGENIKTIKKLHPRFEKNIKKIMSSRDNLRYPVENVTSNIYKSSQYSFSKKPNVLIAIPWMTFGGAETVISNFAKELKDSFGLSFVTGLKCENEWEYKFKEITPNIYHLHNLFGDKKELYLEFISNYIKTRNVKILHIIHTNFVFDILEELKRRHPELKIVVTMFNDRVGYFKESTLHSELIDIYTSDNNAVAESYKKLLKNATIKVLPNGIDSQDTFAPELYDAKSVKDKMGSSEKEMVVLYIGRLSKEKNPKVVLEVAKNLLSVKDLGFYIIGDGPLRAEMEETIEKWKLTNVKYLGYQSSPAEYLAATDVFVLPSSIEGFPLSILEAMAMNTAIIASRVGAIPDVVKEGFDGYVVTPGSAKEITDAILDLKKNPEKLELMKSNGRDELNKKYSNVILKKNYTSLYEELLK